MYLCHEQINKQPMYKIKVLLGNITFEGFSNVELKLFKGDTKRKALIHQLKGVFECDSYEEAEKLGEHLLNEFGGTFDYVIPSRFDGEIVIENRIDLKVKEIFS